MYFLLVALPQPILSLLVRTGLVVAFVAVDMFVAVVVVTIGALGWPIRLPAVVAAEALSAVAPVAARVVVLIVVVVVSV